MALPLVTLHFAQSLDARIGLGKGRGRALLSSQAGLECAHRARGAHDAVLIGIETLLEDDPLLTARAGGAQPLRVVLDSALRLPLAARLLRAEPGAGRVLVCCTSERAALDKRRQLEAAGVEVLAVPEDAVGRASLEHVLERLQARGVSRLLVEGGARVLTAFLQARLATRAEVELSPLWLGAPATAALGELGVARLGDALRLDRLEVQSLGGSLLVSGDVLYPERGAT